MPDDDLERWNMPHEILQLRSALLVAKSAEVSVDIHDRAAPEFGGRIKVMARHDVVHLLYRL